MEAFSSENTLNVVRDAFNSHAQLYDENERNNEILQYMRRRVWQSYLENFKSGDHILEINCGTGTDAVFLAQHGIRVLATDLSATMVGLAHEKISKFELTELVDTRILGFHELSSLGNRNFNGIVSNLGGLNCIDDLARFAQHVGNLLTPKGKLIGAVMSKYCLLEIVAFLRRGNLQSAFRRFSPKGIRAKVADQEVKVFYYSPRGFLEHFTHYFTLQKIYGLCLLTPPPYAQGFYHRHKGMVNFAMKMETSVCERFPFYAFGDHFVVELVRKS